MRLTLIFAVTIWLLSSCTCSRTENTNWSFQNQQIADETENSTQTINYPVFDNEFVNDVVSNQVEKLSNQFKSDVGSERISENWKNEQTISVEVFASDKGNLSLLFYNYLFTGGAHGNTMLESFVFDPNGKTVIDLGDVLEGSFFKKLQILTRKKLKAKLGYEAFVDEGTETLSDFTHFILSGDSIRFYFPQYQVASYADGIQMVSFPVADLASGE